MLLLIISLTYLIQGKMYHSFSALKKDVCQQDIKMLLILRKVLHQVKILSFLFSLNIFPLPITFAFTYWLRPIPIFIGTFE